MYRRSLSVNVQYQDYRHRFRRDIDNETCWKNSSRYSSMRDVTHLSGKNILTYRYLLSESLDKQAVTQHLWHEQNPVKISLVSCHRLVQILTGLTTASFSGGLTLILLPRTGNMCRTYDVKIQLGGNGCRWSGSLNCRTLVMRRYVLSKKKKYVTLCLSVSLSSHLSDILSANV